MSAYIVDTETTNRKPPLEIIEAAWIKLPMAADLTGDDPDLIPDLGPVNLYRAVLNRYCERFKPSVPITWGFHCPWGFRPWYEFVSKDDRGAAGPGCD